MTSGTVPASDVATGSCCAGRALNASWNCVLVALRSLTQHMCTKMRPMRTLVGLLPLLPSQDSDVALALPSIGFQKPSAA